VFGAQARLSAGAHAARSAYQVQRYDTGRRACDVRRVAGEHGPGGGGQADRDGPLTEPGPVDHQSSRAPRGDATCAIRQRRGRHDQQTSRNRHGDVRRDREDVRRVQWRKRPLQCVGQ